MFIFTAQTSCLGSWLTLVKCFTHQTVQISRIYLLLNGAIRFAFHSSAWEVSVRALLLVKTQFLSTDL